MENFDWTQFTRKITVNTDLRSLYDAWTKPAELERWFLERAVFTDAHETVCNRSQSAEKGLFYEWKWFTYEVTERGRVMEANGRDHFQFTFAGDCIVTIDLKQRDNDVLVTLTQKNIPTDDESMRNIRLGCHTGWSFFLVNLKSVYEGGLDLRNRDDAQQGMVNS